MEPQSTAQINTHVYVLLLSNLDPARLFLCHSCFTRRFVIIYSPIVPECCTSNHINNHKND
uniref:Uncharacterized protein MANES_04G025800 n=1 Tax=Rhizophora mucronata TaxID=61149 RepID=A0A2P2JH44_RHIMU